MAFYALAAVACLVPGRTAVANDAIAALGAGGLQFEKTAEIEMRSEDLFISVPEVRVRYVFRNTIDHDVTALVAFPLPNLPNVSVSGYDYNLPNEWQHIRTKDPRNYVAFRTRVDGRAVKMDVEERAVAGGVDHGAWLRAHHIPLRPLGFAWEKVPKSDLQQLFAWHMVEVNEGGEVSPIWALRTTFYWRQRFPARRDLVVTHAYIPSSGNYDDHEHGKQPRCPTERSVPMVKGDIIDTSTQVVEYILETGARWKAPIDDFRLVIDKGSRFTRLLVCGEFRKVGATRFEMRRRKFLPTGNLRIVFETDVAE